MSVRPAQLRSQRGAAYLDAQIEQRRVRAQHQPAFARRKLPAYGRELMTLRRRGLVPARGFYFAHVIVVLDDWKLARLFFRLVIAPDDDPQSLDFVGVAGLDVILVYNALRSSQDRVHEAIAALLAGKPNDLILFDTLQAHAPRIIRAPELGIERGGSK